MGDAALIELAKGGDQDAFRQLVERYADMAWRTARVLLAQRESAQDALQEAWIDAWRGLAHFDQGRPFRPWLLAIVANRCRMVARRRDLHTVVLGSIEPEQALDYDDVADAIERLEADEELDIVLASLSPDHQRILELRYFADLELSEIALVLGLPLGTVKSRLHRALDALRQLLPVAPNDRGPAESSPEGWTRDSQ